MSGTTRLGTTCACACQTNAAWVEEIRLDPGKPPRPELLNYAFEQGWLLMDEFNWAMNSQEQRLFGKPLRRRVQLNSSIVAGFDGPVKIKWTACPVCSARLPASRLSGHLRRAHRLVQSPSASEAALARESERTRKKALERKKGRMKRAVAGLLSLARAGDVRAENELAELQTMGPLKGIIRRLIARQRFKRGRFSRTGLPQGGRSVQGGAPGLGKRA